MENVNFLKEGLIGVYMIHCKCNNKNYIGSSINVYSRISEQLKKLKNGNHYISHVRKEKSQMQKDFDLYGEFYFDLFIIEIFKNITIGELRKIEFDTIIKYNSFNPLFGYNKNTPATIKLIENSKERENISNIISNNIKRPKKYKNCILNTLTNKEIRKIDKLSKNIKFK